VWLALLSDLFMLTAAVQYTNKTSSDN